MRSLSRRETLALAATPWLTAAAPRSIDEQGFVPIGGIEQWISVKGADAASPLILFLHGGPGEAPSPFLDLFQPYEQDFTLALWDQRGAGKTFGRSGGRSTPGMDQERFVQDGIEVAEHLRRRFAKSRIVLVGHSWGAALGLRIAERRPDLFHAMVGTGQPVSQARAVLSQERFARETYQRNGDTEALKALDAVASLPPTDSKRRFATRKVLFGADDKRFLAREDAFMGPKPWPITGEVADWIGGYTFTSEVLVPKILGHEVIDEIGLDLPLPFVVIQGRDDLICPTDVAHDYLMQVKAPAKAYAEIPGGHFACYTAPEDFLAALRRHVRPLCGA